MGEFEQLATESDYENRYGPAPDNIGAVLSDASDALHAAYIRFHGEPWRRGASPVFDLGARAACCSIAHAALSAPDGFDGVTQVSQTAGPYSATVHYQNPHGDLFIPKSVLKRLGLAGMRVGSIAPRGCGDA